MYISHDINKVWLTGQFFRHIYVHVVDHSQMYFCGMCAVHP